MSDRLSDCAILRELRNPTVDLTIRRLVHQPMHLLAREVYLS